MQNNKRALAVAISAVILSQSLPVFAAVDEIIVTARKREESIMKVPVVESVLDQQQLEQFGTSSLQAASEQVPGLLVGSATLGFGSQVSLRGVGTSTLNATIDQSVSLNIDGMQMSQGLAYKAGMFDMMQMEVLKGPQALFYGKSSPGGVISIHTASPTDKFELILRQAHEFEAEADRSDFIISGPVNDELGLRLAATYLDEEGYFENKAQALPGSGGSDPKYRDFAPHEEWMVRGTGVWTPSEKFDARLKLNMTHDRTEGDGGSLQMSSCPDGLAAPSGIAFLGGGENCKIDKKVYIVDVDKAAFPSVRNNGTPFSDMDQKFGTLELNYDVQHNVALTSVTGYYELDQSSMINGTNTTYAGPALVADPDFEREEFTQELRLTSDFRGAPLNYMAGLFYQDGSMTYHNNLLGNTLLGFPAQLNKGVQDIDMKTQSIFGQLIWAVTDRFELAAGARYTKEDRKHSVFNELTGSNVEMAVPELTSEDVSPELTATYRPTDDLTVFGSIKQAYKSGSFDTVTIKDAGTDVSFGDEKVTGAEVGVKTQLLDRRLRLNVAAYYNKYDDMQVGANDNAGGQIAIRTLNAATATVQGIDMDATYLPLAVDGLAIRGGVNYNRATYDDFDNATCWGGQTIAEGCNQIYDASTGLYTAQDLSGRDLMRAPEWMANFGLDYETAVGDGMTLALGLGEIYSSEYFTNLLLRDDMIQDAYFKTNASIALRGKDDMWEVALIGNNLTDELVTGNCVNANLANGAVLGGQITGGTTRGPAGVDEIQCNVEPGREIWLRLTLKLGS